MLSSLQQLDQKIFLELQDLVYGHHWLIVISVILASPGLFIALLIFVLLWFFGKSHDEKKQNRIALSSALLAAFIARFILKEIITAFWSRPRPFETLQTIPSISHNPGSAFPSGHATFLFALATAIWMYDRKMGIFFGVLALLVSVSRVIVGIHWPGDILGGIILGVATSLALYRPIKRYIERFF